MTNKAHSKEKQYFDLVTNGIGYLNRARVVSPEKGGDSYLCVDITAMFGEIKESSKDSVTYVHFDSIVKGDTPIELVKKYKSEINDKDTKVLVSFSVGDAHPNSYLIEDRDSGTTKRRHNMKGRLIGIKHMKINGAVVYVEPKDEEVADESHDSPSSEETEAVDTTRTDVQSEPSSDSVNVIQKVVEINMPDREGYENYLVSQGFNFKNADEKYRYFEKAA